MINKKTVAAIILSCSIFATHAANHVMIQIGSFRNPQLATQQSAKAALIGVRTRIVEFRHNNILYYRVITLPVPQDVAEKTLTRLQQNNIAAIVITQ